MRQDTIVLISTYLGQALLAAILAAVLATFWRIFRRTYLNDWALSFGAFAIYLLGGAGGLMLTRGLPPTNPARLSITFITLTAGYLQLAWLVFGAAALTGRLHISIVARRRILVGAVVLAAVATLLFTWDAELRLARVATRVGLRALLTGLSFLVTAWLVVRSEHRAGRVGPRISSLAFAFYGLGQMTYAVAFFSELVNGPAIGVYAVPMGLIDVIAQATMGLGMIIWLLEDERQHSLATERSLSEHRSLLASVVDSTSDAIWSVDADCIIRAANPTFDRLFTALIGLRPRPGLAVLDVLPPELRAMWAALYKRSLGGERFTVEQQYGEPNQPAYWEVSLNPVYAEDGGVTGVSVVSRDVTERKLAEAARLRAVETAQQTQRLEGLGALAGGIAHDFNNILAGVLANAQLVREDLPAEHPAKPLLRDIENLSRRGSDLTSQMLTYAGQGQIAVQLLDISSHIDRTASLLHAAVPKKTELRLALARGLPTIEIDPAMLSQVLFNLVTNAAEALGDEGGAITISTAPLDADAATLAGYRGEGTPGRYVQLEVADTGPGMPAESLARIFDPFYSTKFTGRGLGLSVVLSIVQRHGGLVRVDSSPGTGTTVSALFPVATRAAVTAPAAARTSTGIVLIVDDEPDIRRVTARILDRLGYRTLVAADGVEGLERFRAEPAITAVILDRTMPRLNGEEVLREIRSTHPKLPVIICSGYGEDAIGPLDAHTVFVHKPFEVATLTDTLQSRFGVLPPPS